MMRHSISRIQFNGSAELVVRCLVVLLLVEYHASGIVYRREFRIDIDSLIEVLHGLADAILLLAEHSQMVQDVDVARLQLRSPTEIGFLLTRHPEFAVAERPIVVALVVFAVEFDGLRVVGNCLLVLLQLPVGEGPIVEEVSFAGVQLNGLSKIFDCFLAEVLSVEANTTIVVAERVVRFQ